MGTTLKDILGNEYRDDLTLTELDALISPVVDTLTTDRDKYKKSFEKASSDIGKLKEQHRAGQDADEQAKEDRSEEIAKLTEERDALARQVKINDFANNYLAQGYDKDLANKTAEALADGDFKTVFANENKFLTAQKKQIEADALKNTPTPDGGEVDKGLSFEDFTKLKYTDRLQLQDRNPALYAEYAAKEQKIK